MKKASLIILLIIIAVGGWYAYREYNRTNADLKNKKADYNMYSSVLIGAFEQDTALANQQYVDKIVSVTGNVKSIDAAGNPAVISLGDAGQMSSVQCSMDSTHAADYKNIEEGDRVTIKGICSGGRTQSLFGTDVIISRSIVESSKRPVPKSTL